MEEKTPKKNYCGTVLAGVALLLLFVINGVYVVRISYGYVVKRLQSAARIKAPYSKADWRDSFDDDFKYYLTGARMLREGETRLYDLKVTKARGIMSWIMTYPPTAYYMFIPATLIPEPDATDIWLLSKFVSIFLSGWLLTGVFYPRAKSACDGQEEGRFCCWPLPFPPSGRNSEWVRLTCTFFSYFVFPSTC